MKVIILAAGIGSRLGNPYPKPLTMLDNGCSILQNQINGLLKYINIEDIFVVVGFKKELIMEAFPDLTYVYNDYFDTTNTSKSLLKALKKVKDHDVIWMNGDVVFDSVVVKRVMNSGHSSMAVNTESVADEEVKYITDPTGKIIAVSKTLSGALGEAVGINKVKKSDIPLFIKELESCKNQDYFEKGIEQSIKKGLDIYPIDISDLLCTEIDFKEDLDRVNEQLLVRG